MRKATPATRPAVQTDRPVLEAYNEADWVDWDHWQAVEELQDFLDGVHDRHDIGESFDTPDDDTQVARQMRRHGLQVDG